MSVKIPLIVEGKANTQGATRGLSGMQAGIVSLNAAIELGQKAFAALSAAIEASVGASLVQERSNERLRGTFERVGIDAQSAMASVADFTAQMQRTTRFGDNEMQDAIRRIAQSTAAIGASTQDILGFAEVAADVAEATGQDLSSAAAIVSRAAAGQAEALNRLLPAYRDQIREISQLESASERGAAAMELLSENFDGAAESLNPLDLALSRISNGLGDFREAVGATITQSPEAQAAFTQLADTIDGVVAAFSEGGPAAELFTRSVVDSLTSVIGITITATEQILTIIASVQAALATFRRDQAMELNRYVNDIGAATIGGGVTSESLAGLTAQQRAGLLVRLGLDGEMSGRELARNPDIVNRRLNAEFGAGGGADAAAYAAIATLEQLRSTGLRSGGSLSGPSGAAESPLLGPELPPGYRPPGTDPRRPSGRSAGPADMGGGFAGGGAFGSLMLGGMIDAGALGLRAMGEAGKTSDAANAMKEFAAAEREAVAAATELALAMQDTAIADQAAQAEMLAEAWRNVGVTLKEQVEPAVVDFSANMSAAMGSAAATGENFGHAAQMAAKETVAGVAQQYGRLLLTMAPGLFALGMVGRGVAAATSGAALIAGGAFIGAAGGRSGGNGGAGSSGVGSAPSLSDNFRPSNSPAMQETKLSVFLDGEPLAANYRRQESLGGINSL